MHCTFVFALSLLIISITTHLFIHFTTEKRKKGIMRNIYRYIVKNIKKRRFFLNSKRREYLATGTQGQNSPTIVPTVREKEIDHIVSFSCYFKLKHSLIWYAYITSQNDKNKSTFNLVLHCICMTVDPCTKVL